MTDSEIMEYVSKKPKIKHFMAGIYCHTDLTWEKEDGINTIVCLYCDNARGHEDEFVISSGCGNRNSDVDFCKTHKKVYKKNTLTPELLDKIIEKEIPALYKKTYKDVMDYYVKIKKAALEQDFK